MPPQRVTAKLSPFVVVYLKNEVGSGLDLQGMELFVKRLA